MPSFVGKSFFNFLVGKSTHKSCFLGTHSLCSIFSSFLLKCVLNLNKITFLGNSEFCVGIDIIENNKYICICLIYQIIYIYMNMFNFYKNSIVICLFWMDNIFCLVCNHKDIHIFLDWIERIFKIIRHSLWIVWFCGVSKPRFGTPTYTVQTSWNKYYQSSTTNLPKIY